MNGSADIVTDVHVATQHPAVVLERWFDVLHREGVTYCVVGDSRRLPGIIEGDVDLVVDTDSFARIPQLLVRFCRSLGVKLVQAIQHEPTACYFVITGQRGTGQSWYLHCDICSDYYQHGTRLLRAEELLADRSVVPNGGGDASGFFVAAPAREFVYYVLKKVAKGALSDRQGTHLNTQWRADPAGARAQLERFWDRHHVELIAYAAENNTWDGVRELLPVLKNALRRRSTRSMRMRWRELWRRIDRAIRPSGCFIAFLGPDGSGKSSLINRVLPRLAPSFRRMRFMHFRPRWGTEMSNSSPVDAPHDQEPRMWLTSTLKLFYYLADYILGYVPLRLRLIRSTLVAFDRYYYDLFIDPRRFRFRGPMRLATWGAKLVPRPDLVIVLDAATEVLHHRKQEVSAEETARQRDAYRVLAERLPNARLVDASAPLDAVAEQVVQLVTDHLAERTARRLRLKSKRG